MSYFWDKYDELEEIVLGSLCYKLQGHGLIIEDNSDRVITMSLENEPDKYIMVFIQWNRAIRISLVNKEASPAGIRKFFALREGIENIDREFNYLLEFSFFSTPEELLGLLEYIYSIFVNSALNLLLDKVTFSEVAKKLDKLNYPTGEHWSNEMIVFRDKFEEQKYLPIEWTLDTLFKGKLKHRKKPKKKALTQEEFDQQFDHDTFWYYRVPYSQDLEKSLQDLRENVFKNKQFNGADENPSTIQEALDNMLEYGTESILDVEFISKKKEPGAAFLLFPDYMRVKFGFTKVDWGKFTANRDLFLEKLGSGECFIIPLTENKQITEYVFLGRHFRG
jgi:hypothetical protein